MKLLSKFLMIIATVIVSTLSPPFSFGDNQQQDKEALKLLSGEELEETLETYLREHHGWGKYAASGIGFVSYTNHDAGLEKFRDALLMTQHVRDFSNVWNIQLNLNTYTDTFQSSHLTLDLTFNNDDPTQFWIKPISEDLKNETIYLEFIRQSRDTQKKHPIEFLQSVFIGINLKTYDRLYPTDSLQVIAETKFDKFLQPLIQLIQKEKNFKPRYAPINIFVLDESSYNGIRITESTEEVTYVSVGNESYNDLFNLLKSLPEVGSYAEKRAMAVNSAIEDKYKELKALGIKIIFYGDFLTRTQRREKMLQGMLNLKKKIDSGEENRKKIFITNCWWCDDEEFDYADGNTDVEPVIQEYMKKLEGEGMAAR